MSGAAIRVEGLGKMYRIGGPVERYKTLRESVTRAVAGAGRKLSSLFGGGNGSGPGHETIWALKDVSFEVQPGEVVGIIGRNGAGKSTLLKILSRITEPTEGRVEIRGRVGSLLEVGTGFHPELTGRENVYLNGAILGMKRAEVDRKFDEIVAFAEVEKFIDTPVKHYSSGMYVRLAFSVAAHLDTEVLLIDEVLSVGDLSFQRKCFKSIESVAKSGLTVIFVSHNMSAVQALCSKGIIINRGHIAESGDIHQCVSEYLRSVSNSDASREHHSLGRFEFDKVRFERVEVLNGQSGKNVWMTGRPALLRFVFTKPLTDAYSCIITVYDLSGAPIFSCNTREASKHDTITQTPFCELYWHCEELPLLEGQYLVNAAIINGGVIEDHLAPAALVTVIGGECYGRHLPNRPRGFVAVRHFWTTQHIYI